MTGISSRGVTMKRFLVAALVLFAPPAWGADPKPGDRFFVDLNALPPPKATPSKANPADVVPRPKGATLKVPAGWRATLFAERLDHPRNLLVLPDGSLLVAEQRADKLTRLVDKDGDGQAESRSTFAEGFAEPFGLAFHGDAVWVADTRRVWRLPWSPGVGRVERRDPVTETGALGDDRGHSTRSLAIAPDGRHFYVGIGSRSNLAEEEEPRATVQEFALDGGGQRTFAAGLRNPVGMAFRPGTEELWAVVNERDGQGDELVPDYLTQVGRDAFYGWPYAYIGHHPQPGFAEKAPERVKRTRVPDLLFRSHSAPLGLAFLDGDAYVGLHGSWNRSTPIGYFVARVPFKDGKPQGGYEAFATGFTVSPGTVWGRPVGIAATPDGALYVADDAGRTVWKISREK
ncbi:MAG: PQQ-dependent sugar dehydrogenase [Magnetospirillum sp.]|nr:PQQ-dependent sugar dehydrogenase [Magnetospirillum sp.]